MNRKYDAAQAREITSEAPVVATSGKAADFISMDALNMGTAIGHGIKGLNL